MLVTCLDFAAIEACINISDSEYACDLMSRPTVSTNSQWISSLHRTRKVRTSQKAHDDKMGRAVGRKRDKAIATVTAYFVQAKDWVLALP